MSKKLKDKIALITGGTEGIGLATAKLFAKEGAYVFITGRRQKELDEAVKAIGGNVFWRSGRRCQTGRPRSSLRDHRRGEGAKSILFFANAGVGEFVPFRGRHRRAFRQTIQHQCEGNACSRCKRPLPLLNDGGSIILNGSVASVKGTAAFGVYAASKAAIRSFRANLDYGSEGPSDSLQRC